MATTPSPTTTIGNAGFVTKGAPGVKGHFTDNRKFSLSDLIVWQERRWAKLDMALRMKSQVVAVDDPQPKVITNLEAPIKFAVTTASSDGINTEDTLGMTDANAAFIQSGDVFEVSGLFCNATGTTYGTTKLGSDLFPETVICTAVTPSGLAAGTAKVVVSRGNGNDPASPTEIATTMFLIHIGNALSDDANAPTPIHFEPAHIQNNCQFFSRTWSMTDQEKPLNTYGKMSMEDRAAVKRKEFFRGKELAMFRGRKSNPTINNKDQLLTGGILEFIPIAGDAIDGETRIIDFGGPFDLETYMTNTEIIGRYGSDVKWSFVGGKHLSALWSSFQQAITYNDEISTKVGYAVWELDLGHQREMITRHPMYTDISTTAVEWSFDKTVVDLEYIRLMVYIDVQTKDDIQSPRAHREENEIFCQVGVWRTFADAHSHWFGITA